MKKLKHLHGFFLGFLCAILMIGLGLPVMAAYQKQVTLHYDNIGIQLNEETIVPKDVQGNVVEPFIIEGTTYLPVRAISEALGAEVNWDDATKTVKLNYNLYPEEPYVRLMGCYKIISEEAVYLRIQFQHMKTAEGIAYLQETVSGEKRLDFVISSLREGLALVEGHYNNCKDYFYEDSFSVVAEYKRLYSLAISQLELIKSASSSQVSTINKASTQYYLDAYTLQDGTDNLFWELYQTYYS